MCIWYSGLLPGKQVPECCRCSWTMLRPPLSTTLLLPCARGSVRSSTVWWQNSCSPPSPAVTGRSSGPARQPPPDGAAPATTPCCAGCWTAPQGSTAWPWTRTCAGGCGWPLPPRVPPHEQSSTPNWNATRPQPAGLATPPLLPLSRTRRSRTPPGRPQSTAPTFPMSCFRQPLPVLGWAATSCWTATSGTTSIPWRQSGPSEASNWRPGWWAASTPAIRMPWKEPSRQTIR